MYTVTPSLMKMEPAINPRITVRPASYRYLCPLFFKNLPRLIAIISRNIMRRISMAALPYFNYIINHTYLSRGLLQLVL